MNREFAGNAVLIVVLNLVVKSFYLFGIDRTVQNLLPEGEYGLYFTLFNFAFIFQIISDFGLQNFNARNLSQSRHLLQKYFPHLLTIKLLLGAAFTVITVLLGYWWGFRSTGVWVLLLIICVNQFLQTLVLFLRSNLAGLGLYRLDSWASVLDKSLLVIIAGVLLWGPGLRTHFTIIWFVLAQTGAYVITIFLLLWYLRPRLGQLRLRWRGAQVQSLLRQSAPYALVVFLMTAYTRLDAVMIEKLLPNGAVEADRYASAFRLLDASNIAGYLLAGLLLPMFARQLKTATSIVPLTRLAISTMWTGAISLSISVIWFAVPIMTRLYTNGDGYSGAILQWLMLTFIPMSGGYVYGTLLTANASLRPMNWVFVAGIFINITLNLLLIPRYGALGAAQATFITQSLTFLAQLALAKYLLQLPFAPALLLRLILLSGLLVALGYYLNTHLLSVPLFVKFSTCICAGILGAFALKLLDLKSWWSWLRPQ
jgi:O-antigen/teichoic acid export membrane protein